MKGHLSKIEHAEDFSILTEPMGPAIIEDGTIQSLDFNFTGTDHQMTGTVRMPYDDLKIGVLKKDEETQKLEKKKLLSFAANLFVKNSNPSGPQGRGARGYRHQSPGCEIIPSSTWPGRPCLKGSRSRPG